MNSPARVVFDTNVYISGLVFGGAPAELLFHAVAGSFILCVSDQIREEVDRILKVKFRWSDSAIRRGCDALWETAVHVSTSTVLAVVPGDPDDNRILECAVDAGAGIVVTGDDHLLKLIPAKLPEVVRAIRIVTPRQFLNELS